MTGGGGLHGLTDTTETLTEGHTAWTVVATARLEVPLYGLRGITMDNVVYMIGKVVKGVRMGWWGNHFLRSDFVLVNIKICRVFLVTKVTLEIACLGQSVSNLVGKPRKTN